jgi:hypothetical protein
MIDDVSGNFYRDVIMKDPRFNSPLRCSAMALLEPVTRAAVSAIMHDALVEYNQPMMVFETYRSQARQMALYNSGASQLRDVGVHHLGLACDIVKSVRGNPSWDGDFRFMAVLARRHGLISGVDWGQPGQHNDFPDSTHVQRVLVRQQPLLFAGQWYPESNYSPWEQDGTMTA